MTEVQWIFQYLLVEKRKKEQLKKEQIVVKACLDRIQDMLLFVSGCIDPEKTAKVIEELNKEENGGQYKLSEDEQKDYEIMKASPEFLEVSYEIDDPSELNTAPSVNREKFRKLAAKLETYKTKEELLNSKQNGETKKKKNKK